MKKIWHICFKTQDEVFFRSHADHNYFFNGLGSALVKTDSLLYAEAEMSNHCHQVVSSSNVEELVRLERMSYNKYFNNKYFRKGPLGEPGFFSMEIDGVCHFLAAIVYTVRNSVHHGVTKTPFMYPYCSANCFFRKELGKSSIHASQGYERQGLTVDQLLPTEKIKDYLPRRAEYKKGWHMTTEGVFLRESVIETKLVETNFVTPQAFLYMMSRRSSEEWRREQEERDHNAKGAITLEKIEDHSFSYINRGHTQNNKTEEERDAEKQLSRMLENEKGHFSPPQITDLTICEIIDNQYVPKFKKGSVYCLSRQEKESIANDVYKKYHPRLSQIRRCLAMK